jgi:predicted Zn finger-like uncharacterized protein
MLIVCPSCATSYDVGLASLSPSGRQVRCARCRTVWHAELNQSEKLVAAAAAIAPHHDAGDQIPAPPESAGPRPSEPTADVVSNEAATPPAAVPATDNDHSAGFEEETSAAGSIGAMAEVLAPPIVPADGDNGGPMIEGTAGHPAERPRDSTENVETVAARRLRNGGKRRRLHWPLSQMQTGVLALALINIILIGWRTDVVRALPQTASFYRLLGLPVNLRGLTFSDVVTGIEQHEGVPILVVEGNVINKTHRAADVPRLKFIVRNAARQEIYSWSTVPSRNVLQPGEAETFRARLASPPPDAHDLVLRFVTRRDILSGIH